MVCYVMPLFLHLSLTRERIKSSRGDTQFLLLPPPPRKLSALNPSVTSACPPPSRNWLEREIARVLDLQDHTTQRRGKARRKEKEIKVPCIGTMVYL
jgi:hypothetical protein